MGDMTLVVFYMSDGVDLPICATANPDPVYVETLLSKNGSVLKQGSQTYHVTAKTRFRILQTPQVSSGQVTNDATCVGEGRVCTGVLEDVCKEGHHCFSGAYATGKIRTACGPGPNNKTNYNQRSRSVSFRWRLFRDQDEDS